MYFASVNKPLLISNVFFFVCLFCFCFLFFSGHEHLKLIFDFSVWVLKAHPDDGLKVTRKI